MHGSAASGLTQMAAATVSSAVTAAISVSGIAKRIVRVSASMSAVVRETRSPVPARSTVESGSASTRCMKSSRSSANIFSESTNDVRRGEPGDHRLRDEECRKDRDDLVDVARGRSLAHRLHEPAEQRRAGKACAGRRPRAGGRRAVIPPRWRRASSRACSRSSRRRDRQQIAHESSPSRVTR